MVQHPSAACALVFLSLLACSQAALMAIDLGNEYLKICLIKPGRQWNAIVVNEMSKRKTPALIGFVNDDRLIGEEAFSVLARYPHLVFQHTRDLLGKYANDSTIPPLLAERFLPYEVVDHPKIGTAAIKVDDEHIYSAHELVGSIFQYARQITEAQAGGSVVDAVLTVPAFWGQAQRQAIIDAAGLAGINVLALLNTHAAAAVQYGIERDFRNKSENVVLYDMGSGSVEVALVRYSSYGAKEAGKATRVNQVAVLDVDWDASLGANALDAVLAEHFAAQFNAKHPQLGDVRKSPKAMVKMLKQVRRTKEILSANSAAPFSVEELHQGRDFQSTITRDEFEALAGDFFERAKAPLIRLLKRNGLKPADVDAVELLGGGSRVPRLQSALSEALAGRHLERHLDADEAVVLGAGLAAANLSTSFRLKKFGMVDGAQYGVNFVQADGLLSDISRADGGTAATTSGSSNSSSSGVKRLLAYMKRLPVTRVVHFRELQQDTVRFSLAYNASTPHRLPPGVTQPELGAWEVSGVSTVIDRYNRSGTVNLRFEADHGGVVKFAGAEAVVEAEEMVEQVVFLDEPAAANATGNASANGTSAGDNATAADATTTSNGTSADPPKWKTVLVPKTKIYKVALNVSGGFHQAPLASEDQLALLRTLRDWQRREAIKRENSRAKNDLESYIINTREALETNGMLLQVTTEEQRMKFLEQLTDMEDWLYSDGEAEAAAEFKKRLATLKAVGDPMSSRAHELEERPRALQVVSTKLQLDLQLAAAWAETKPWVNEKDRAEVLAKLQEFKDWLDSKREEQQKRQDHEEPVFKVAEVIRKFDAVDKLFTTVNNKRKPRPPKVASAANGTANATAAASDEAGEDVGPEGGEDVVEGDSKDQGSESQFVEAGAGSGSANEQDNTHDEL